MSRFAQLLEATADARRRFIEIPLIQDTMREGAPKALYLDFLGQAYHHVKHTVPLLALALARCGPDDPSYQNALIEYIVEERGHEEWILDDIYAIGGNAEEVRTATPRSPCRVMVGHAYYLIDHVSPFAMLGMVHVLEGMSVALADKAVAALQRRLQSDTGAGFKYLTTHGGLDVEHTKLFESLIAELPSSRLTIVIDAARDFYRLYGDIFRDIDARREDAADAEDLYAHKRMS
jgi:pyrroloquinoline quinone (PQQ) biosynthesis protein C